MVVDQWQPPHRPPPPPLPPPRLNGGGPAVLGIVGGLGVFLVVFALLAWFVHAMFPPVAALEIKRAANDFAASWQNGTLDSLSYDPRSAPDVRSGDPKLIMDNTTWLTRWISDVDADRPTKVELAGSPSSNVDGTATQPLAVTWNLGRSRSWTYQTTLTLGSTGGRLRVIWKPSSIYPGLQHGLILKGSRLLATRAPIQSYNGQIFPPSSPDQVAGELVGATAKATHELAELDPGRIAPGDPVGVSGLQQLYDAQLAGEPGVEVDVVSDPNYAPIEPVQRVAFVSPPTPGKPLVLTLDDRLQRRAEDALLGVKAPAALVAVDVRSGQLLAVANGGVESSSDKGPHDRALQGQVAPGEAFRLVTMLAAYRYANLRPDSPVNCAPFDFNGQQFRNAAGAPNTNGVGLGTAFAQNCSTAFARAALMVRPLQLSSAASDLGFGSAVPQGYPTFLGLVATTPPPGIDADLAQVQDGAGQGGVLVSPLAMARAAATAASGLSVPPTLVLTSPRTAPSPATTLTPEETAVLQQVMQQSVAQDGALTSLRTVAGGQAAAIGGTAAYGPAAGAPRNAWVTGYQGTVAFSVLLTRPTCGVRQAADIAAAFLGSVPAASCT